VNLDRIAIDVEARLAAESIIGSATVILLPGGTLDILFERTDGYLMAVFIEPAQRRGWTHDMLVDHAAAHMTVLARANDDPNAVHAPEVMRP